ncbi:MAG TPA: TIGR02300 family protein [Sphingomonadales bacterium]|nr:TIGR02300 family protein [Sphingomonadales bacterium]
MANPEWGTKRQCPKCGTRFYDLGNFEPIVCIDCEHKFKPEVILKSKMAPLELMPEEKTEDTEEELLEVAVEDDDIEIDADDNTVVLSDDDDTNVADVVLAPTPKTPDE